MPQPLLGMCQLPPSNPHTRCDVDWHGGLITVRGKGNRRDRLPLPVDVGRCLVDYPRGGRPDGALDRSVFVRVNAPLRGLTSGGVTQAVAAASQRAGFGTVYGHRLRHSAATSMLAAGAGLAEIGQVLRHRRVLTTAGYAVTRRPRAQGERHRRTAPLGTKPGRYRPSDTLLAFLDGL